MTPEPGPRTVRTRRTRRDIRRAAMDLFLSRGFDSVTTVEVARASGVSPATLFNHFDTKEDLVFGQVEELEQALVAVVTCCARGRSVLSALRDHVLYELTAGRAYTDPAAVATFHRLVERSPRLLAREFDLGRRREALLADALHGAIDDLDNPLTARIAAAQFVTAERIIATELRHRLCDGTEPAAVIRDLDPFIDDVFAALRGGVGDLPRNGSGPAAAESWLSPGVNRQARRGG